MFEIKPMHRVMVFLHLQMKGWTFFHWRRETGSLSWDQEACLIAEEKYSCNESYASFVSYTDTITKEDKNGHIQSMRICIVNGEVKMKCQSMSPWSWQIIAAKQLLEWRRQHKHNFLLLSWVALFVRSIPASSAHSERVFSVSGYTINENRTSLKPETVDDFMILHSNFSKKISCPKKDI